MCFYIPVLLCKIRRGLWCLLFDSVFCKLCGYQILIGNTLRQFAGFFQNILKQGEGFFLKNQIIFPGILIIITGDDGGKCLKVCFLELWLDDLGDFLRRVGRYVIHSLLEGVGEGLDDIWIGFDVALLCRKSSVGNVTGIFSKGSNYVAVAFGFKGGCVGLKLYCEGVLLLQFCDKMKAADLVGFLVYLNIPYGAFPESLLMGFIQRKV